MKRVNIKMLYKNWWVHNMLAHPVMQILIGLGMEQLGTYVHDATLPATNLT